jgi:hypothetical protein
MENGNLMLEAEAKDHYYGFVDKGMIDSPGAVKEYGEN